MTVWFVSAVYGREAVSRLAMCQWAHLRGELAGRGVELHVVVVGDDGNLATAEGFGFDTLERPNVLGLKINDGIEYAGGHDPDWVCWTGSDNWLHPDLVSDAVELDGIVSGRSLAILDLDRPRMRVLHVGSNVGAPPWFIDAATLKTRQWRPVNDRLTRGLDGDLAWSLHGTRWHFVDPNQFCRVDFKGPESMSQYHILQHLGYGPEHQDPFPVLADHYPADLVGMAASTSLEMAA